MDVDALVERWKQTRDPWTCGVDSAAILQCERGFCACAESAGDAMAAALLALRDDVVKWQGIAAREASHGAEVWAERDALRAERDALREQLQYAADSFRSLGCAVDADECEAALSPAEQPKEEP